jgi:hypothetical protein
MWLNSYDVEAGRDEHRTYDCDCCGALTPICLIQRCWTTTGIETFACPACRGEEEEPYEDDR